MKTLKETRSEITFINHRPNYIQSFHTSTWYELYKSSYHDIHKLNGLIQSSHLMKHRNTLNSLYIRRLIQSRHDGLTHACHFNMTSLTYWLIPLKYSTERYRKSFLPVAIILFKSSLRESHTQSIAPTLDWFIYLRLPKSFFLHILLYIQISNIFP